MAWATVGDSVPHSGLPSTASQAPRQTDGRLEGSQSRLALPQEGITGCPIPDLSYPCSSRLTSLGVVCVSQAGARPPSTWGWGWGWLPSTMRGPWALAQGPRPCWEQGCRRHSRMSLILSCRDG